MNAQEIFDLARQYGAEHPGITFDLAALLRYTRKVQEPVAWWKRHRDGSVELNDARTFIAEDAIATGRRPLIFGDTSPPQRPAESVQEPVIGPCEHALIEVLAERDGAEDYIDVLLDEVLGPDRAEWSSAYGRADALEEVRERIAQMLKPSIDKAWNRFEVALAQQAEPVSVADLQAALAEPVQEPVAWDGTCVLGYCNSPAGCENSGECRAGYAPPQRPAEPVQEPVAYSVGRTLHWHEGKGVNDAQLYAAPAQAEPVQEPVQEPDHTYKLIGCVQHDCEECQRRTRRPAEPVGVVTSMVKGGVVWQRWPADMPDGTLLFSEVQP